MATLPHVPEVFRPVFTKKGDRVVDDRGRELWYAEGWYWVDVRPTRVQSASPADPWLVDGKLVRERLEGEKT
jgi:hypothetical protein